MANYRRLRWLPSVLLALVPALQRIPIESMALSRKLAHSSRSSPSPCVCPTGVQGSGFRAVRENQTPHSTVFLPFPCGLFLATAEGAGAFPAVEGVGGWGP